MPDIPLDIKLAIVDELNDLSTQESRIRDPFSGIALIWPEVLFRIRQHRFSTIRLRTANGLCSLQRILESAPSICHVVRKVYVPEINRNPTNPYDDPNLPRLFKLLTGVIAVSFCDIKQIHAAAVASVFRCLPNSITDVHLQIAPQPRRTLSDIFVLLRAFPNMERLWLWCMFEYGQDVAEQLVAEPFLSLRSIELPWEIYKRDYFPISSFAKRGLFPNVESLTLPYVYWGDPYGARLNELLRCWSSSLRELQFRFNEKAVSPDLGIAAFDLPRNLHRLEFQTLIPFDERLDSPGDLWHLDLWVQTLEQRCRSGGTLQSVTVTLTLYPWPELQHTAAHTARSLLCRLDGLLGSKELKIMHLDWQLLFNSDQNTPLPENSGAVSQRVIEDMFPATSLRFFTEAGRNRFGTTTASTPRRPFYIWLPPEESET